MSFWSELKRRNVVKVGIAYAIVAWLIIHPVDIIFPILHLPEWSITFVAALLIFGFPFVIIFAWVFESFSKSVAKLTVYIFDGIKKRNVVKVAIAYIVLAWLIIHMVDIIFPILHLPEWSTTLVAALLIIAFPFVIIFSWVYETTPLVLNKTKEDPASKSITQITGKRLN
jgi:hypothetical protein